MTDAEYHADKSLSKHAIDLILECPALYKVWADDMEDEQETEALRFGRIAHKLCLEPQIFYNEYAVTNFNLATKEGREWKKQLPEGIQIVKEREYEQALLMAGAAHDHPQAKYLFQNYTAETAIFWDYQGVKCKAKPDIISIIADLRFCGDYKTTDCASPKAISRAIEKHYYYRQAAWYQMGLEATGQPCERFIFIFVEKKYPHLVTACEVDEEYLEIGREECNEAVQILKKCQETGKYPCYAPTNSILTISPPKWRKGTKNEFRFS